ncbi:hypothetical protein AGMMS50268_23670 [Spirochaetia bacterium]|nr:hypothetical protein AGMMS50268_23670 [Spirochaetia bacterium]
MKYVYKITYPNGKIYIGQDTANYYMTYFGSSDEGLIQKDFSWDQMKDFSVRKQILWSSEDATQDEVTRKEREMILKYESNKPEKGYNQRLP